MLEPSVQVLTPSMAPLVFMVMSPSTLSLGTSGDEVCDWSTGFGAGLWASLTSWLTYTPSGIALLSRVTVTSFECPDSAALRCGACLSSW
jgi:hypothetical protein